MDVVVKLSLGDRYPYFDKVEFKYGDFEDLKKMGRPGFNAQFLISFFNGDRPNAMKLDTEAVRKAVIWRMSPYFRVFIATWGFARDAETEALYKVSGEILMDIKNKFIKEKDLYPDIKRD